jgi:polyhydroxyalkanoate synthase subunit PhaC
VKLDETDSIASRPAGTAIAATAAPEPRPCDLHEEETALNRLDLRLHSALAKMTAGVSPIGLSLAFQDWFMHLAASPGKQGALISLLNQHALGWGSMAGAVGARTSAERHPANGKSVASDARFAEKGWANWPFNAFAKSFLQTQDFWQQATSGIRGVSPHHAQVVNFTANQMLDVFSPSNFSWTNPEVLRASIDSQGRNYGAGWTHWLEDLRKRPAQARKAAHIATEDATEDANEVSANSAYTVGRDVAVTPGKVVYRNDLVELIQYTPQTATVHLEPILIVPSWIMKYYILDLSPHNSLVRYLVQQGHTVFMISWRNPGASDRDLGMDDYLSLGLLDVLNQVARIGGEVPIHAVGYCLGGTLLALAAAALGSGRHTSPAQLKTVTLLAALTDFTDPGELGLFIDDSELALLDAVMWEKGYLGGAQMAGSFQLLNSRDLIWSRMMREYLLGVRAVPNDLMAWNADATRMPYRMHSEYLKRLFLHNDLAEGRYCVNGRAVALKDIKAPMFVLGTERDHVSPWRSVYKINLLSNTELDFVLASGGHNAGIVSEPGHARRSYKLAPHRPAGAAYDDADEWLQTAQDVDGSWWPHWQQWLVQHSGGKRAKPPAMGAGVMLADAPGLYVLGT